LRILGIKDLQLTLTLALTLSPPGLRDLRVLRASFPCPIPIHVNLPSTVRE
jgi:hypothetical protein